MIVDISDKVVVITGASRGVGMELAKAFAKEQAKIVINYNQSEDQAKKLFDEISLYNKNCMIIKADVGNQSNVIKMYQEIYNRYGCIDVLINNAGICDDDLMQMMSIEQWQKVIDINITGTFLCCREVSKIMINQNYGKIINIASLKGQKGSSRQCNYAASKAAIIALTKSLADELGQYNIAVNAVCPGFIVTDLNRFDIMKEKIARSQSVMTIEHSLSDLISFLVFISSNLVSGVSGQVFNFDSRIK